MQATGADDKNTCEVIMKKSSGDKEVVHQPNNLFTHDREVEAVSPPRRSPQNQMQDHAFEHCRCCPCHVGKVDLIGKDFLAEMNKKKMWIVIFVGR